MASELKKVCHWCKGTGETTLPATWVNLECKVPCVCCRGTGFEWTLYQYEMASCIADLERQLAEAQATIAALKTELSAAQAAIAALQWTEITPDNLPKPLVHEVLDPVRGFVGTVFASWPYGRSIEAGWFYFRPISPPAQASATEVKHEG